MSVWTLTLRVYPIGLSQQLLAMAYLDSGSMVVHEHHLRYVVLHPVPLAKVARLPGIYQEVDEGESSSFCSVEGCIVLRN